MSREPSVYRPDQLPTIQHACIEQGIGGELSHSGSSERLRRLFFRCLRLLNGWRRPGQGRSLRRVLIFQHERIGDHILTTPLYGWLRQEYPGVHIDVLCSTANHALVDVDPNVRHAHAMSPRRGLHAGLWSAIRFLRSDTYDAVFVPTFAARTRNALLISLMKGAPRTATFSDRKRAYRYLGFFDAVHVRQRPWEHVSHSVSAIGPTLVQSTAVLPLPYSPAILGRTVRSTDAPTIAIAVESADVRRSWAWEQAVALSDQILHDMPNISVNLVRPLRSSVSDPDDHPRRAVWVGDLVALSGMLARATVVIAANSAVVHLAAAAGVPVVGVYHSVENAAEWYPVGVDFRLILPAAGESVGTVDANVVYRALVDLAPHLRV